MTKAAQNLGRNVRHYRLSAKMSVQNAVDQAGMKRLTWIRIESGKCNPHLSTIEAVAYVLKVPVNALFTALWPNLVPTQDNTAEVIPAGGKAKAKAKAEKAKHIAMRREKFAELNADAKREALEEENRRFYD